MPFRPPDDDPIGLLCIADRPQSNWSIKKKPCQGMNQLVTALVARNSRGYQRKPVLGHLPQIRGHQAVSWWTPKGRGVRSSFTERDVNQAITKAKPNPLSIAPSVLIFNLDLVRGLDACRNDSPWTVTLSPPRRRRSWHHPTSGRQIIGSPCASLYSLTGIPSGCPVHDEVMVMGYLLLGEMSGIVPDICAMK